MISGIPFDGPIGAVRMAYTTDGEWIPHPTFEEGDGVDLRAGRGRPGPHRGRRRRDRHHDGRGRRHREVVGVLRRRRPQGHRGGAGRRASRRPSTWIRESINLQRAARARPSPPSAGPIETIPYSTFTDYGDDVFARVEAVGTEPHRQGQPDHDARPSATRRSTRPTAAIQRRRSPTSSPTARARSRRPSARSPRSSCASASSRRACASTAAASPTSARSRPRSTSSRRPTARRSSSAARPRSST